MADPRYTGPGSIPSSPQCGRWETLLADALDGRLRPEDEVAFTSHMAVCPGCAALFEEARRGREWLEFLSPEPEIPAGLVDRILAQTGPGQAAGFGVVPEGAAIAATAYPLHRPGPVGSGVGNHVRRYAEPRLLMTMAMAFFSIALTLNLVGFRFNEVQLSDLRPSAVRSLLTRHIVTASIPILRYYDHLRFLYRIETSMRQEMPAEDQSGTTPNSVTPGGAGESMRDHGAGSKIGGARPGLPGPSRSHEVDSANSASGYFLDTSLRVKNGFAMPAATDRRWTRHAHSGGSLFQPQLVGGPPTRATERNGAWTA